MPAEILVVDDEPAHRRMLEVVLTARNHSVFHAADGLEAVRAVEEQFYDLILMDIRMSRMGGIEAMQEIQRLSPGIPIIIMTAYASVETAVKALKTGAYDYITKPIDTDELVLTVEKAMDHRRLERENRDLKERISDQYRFDKIIGKSSSMKDLFDLLAQVAPTEATVLVTGESGTGKELIANAIHSNSPRKDAPFIKVNCAALPENLLESELFGHEKGAFTGATARREGRFQRAHTGTIFLDEIAEMSPQLQAKLLRVLQEGEMEPVGSSKTLSVDTRVIAATNRVPTDEIRDGRFREDLYYRLNVFDIEIPRLRDRREDIPLLADFFLKKYAEKNGRLIKAFTPRAIDLIMRYNWPGNVRELENTVERAVILTRNERITPDDLPASFCEKDAECAPEIHPAPGRSLKEMEQEMILKTLEETGGNRTKAADILGISRRTLQLKLKEYGVNP